MARKTSRMMQLLIRPSFVRNGVRLPSTGSSRPSGRQVLETGEWSSKLRNLRERPMA